MTIPSDVGAGKISGANSSSDALSGGATFTGAAEDVSAYNRISVFVDTDVDGTLKMQFSADGTNWDRTKSVDIDTTNLGSGSTHTLTVATQFFRVVYENGASAQSHLRLAVLYHRHEAGVLMSSVDQAISRTNDVQLVRTANIPQWDMARNLYKDRSVFHRFGANDLVPAGERDVWLGGATDKENTDYPWPTTAETLRIKAGGNAADTAAGAGAQSVFVVFLDANWNEVTEELATAGASASSATSVTARRLVRAYVGDVGTYGAANTGDIVIENTTSNQVLGRLGAGLGQTQLTQYTVPAGYTAYARKAKITVDAGANKSLSMRMYQRQNADDVTTPFTGKRLVHYEPAVSGESHTRFETLAKFPAKTDLWWTSEGNAGSSVSVIYDLWLAVDEIVDPQ